MMCITGYCQHFNFTYHPESSLSVIAADAAFFINIRHSFMSLYAVYILCVADGVFIPNFEGNSWPECECPCGC